MPHERLELPHPHPIPGADRRPTTILEAGSHRSQRLPPYTTPWDATTPSSRGFVTADRVGASECGKDVMDRAPLPANPAEQLLSAILQERDAYDLARAGLTLEDMGRARRAAMAAVLTGLLERDLPPLPQSASSLRSWVRAESQLHALF